jgi:hypothetical protein
MRAVGKMAISLSTGSFRAWSKDGTYIVVGDPVSDCECEEGPLIAFTRFRTFWGSVLDLDFGKGGAGGVGEGWGGFTGFAVEGKCCSSTIVGVLRVWEGV